MLAKWWLLLPCYCLISGQNLPYKRNPRRSQALINRLKNSSTPRAVKTNAPSQTHNPVPLPETTTSGNKPTQSSNPILDAIKKKVFQRRQLENAKNSENTLKFKIDKLLKPKEGWAAPGNLGGTFKSKYDYKHEVTGGVPISKAFKNRYIKPAKTVASKSKPAPESEKVSSDNASRLARASWTSGSSSPSQDSEAKISNLATQSSKSTVTGPSSGTYRSNASIQSSKIKSVSTDLYANTLKINANQENRILALEKAAKKLILKHGESNTTINKLIERWQTERDNNLVLTKSMTILSKHLNTLYQQQQILNQKFMSFVIQPHLGNFPQVVPVSVPAPAGNAGHAVG